MKAPILCYRPEESGAVLGLLSLDQAETRLGLGPTRMDFRVQDSTSGAFREHCQSKNAKFVIVFSCASEAFSGFSFGRGLRKSLRTALIG